MIRLSCFALSACSSQGTFGFVVADGGNAEGGLAEDAAPNQPFNDAMAAGDVAAPTVTTVYAHTDDVLYTLDPSTNALTQVGSFSGRSGVVGDRAVTDLAVNSAGDVYVNTESVIYKAAVPTVPGKVYLTKIATIALKSGQMFYALAFTPAGALAKGEVLVGGDGWGELYAIDTTTGTTTDLGNFGPNPSRSGDTLGLSGDLVFYLDTQSHATGLATVRSCKTGSSLCTTSNDYLVAVDMIALATAYKNGAPAPTLLRGIYGGSTSSVGHGVGYGDLFGLGAWHGSVFAFARHSTANTTPLFLSIDTTTGIGTVLSSAFSFVNGWSGAGVSTSAVITVPPPVN
jgi:hypothetical protein